MSKTYVVPLSAVKRFTKGNLLYFFMCKMQLQKPYLKKLHHILTIHLKFDKE